MSPIKTVAIIGAGPGGLVCASKLQQSSSLRITVFEKAPRVGGLWERSSLINPEMQTNFCRFTGTFSDLSWDALELGRPPSVYPKAWMVERYLQHYAEMKIAPGYPPIPILHSTQYRKLEQIIPPSHQSKCSKRRRILVVGGSHSGSETSTLLALQASSARWSPGGNSASEEVQIIHVIHNRMYAVPSFCRDQTSPSVSFHPLEFTLCERATKGPAPLSFAFGLADQQQNQVLAAFYKHVVEGELPEGHVCEELPLYAVVSDSYDLFIRSGVIRPVMGVLRSLNRTAASDTISATIRNTDGIETTISDFSAVINASGFDSSGSVSFLSADVKRQVEFDEQCHRLPLILDASWMSQHSSAPDIAFVGFVPVNWSIMEMQARAIALRWSDGESLACNIALAVYMHALRDAIKDEKQRSKVPQFLFGDFMSIMEQAGRELNLSTVNGESYRDLSGFVCAAQYVGQDEKRTEAESTIAAVQHLQQEIWESDYLLSKVVFLGLLGKWTGRGEGLGGANIEFVPRYPTSLEYDFEYVVIQKTAIGEMALEERIIARYSEIDDEVSLWIVDEVDDLSASELIVALRFRKNEPRCVRAVVRNGSDDPHIFYNLDFKGSRLRGFSMAKNMYNAPCPTMTFERPVMGTASEELVEGDRKLRPTSVALDGLLANASRRPLSESGCITSMYSSRSHTPVSRDKSLLT